MESNSPDLCIVCLSSNISSSEVSWLQFLIPEETPTLASNLCSIFLLRNLLQVPKDKCEEWMKSTFGIDPGNWCSLCVSCSKIVVQAFNLHMKLMSLEKRLEIMRDKLGDKFKYSFHVKEGDDADFSGRIVNIHRVIREYFYEVFEVGKFEEVQRKRYPVPGPKNLPFSQNNDDMGSPQIGNFEHAMGFILPFDDVDEKSSVEMDEKAISSHKSTSKDKECLSPVENLLTGKDARIYNQLNPADSTGNKFHCDTCDATFFSSLCLDTHKKIKHFGDTVPCPYCDVLMNYSWNLTSHWAKNCKQCPGRTGRRRKVTPKVIEKVVKKISKSKGNGSKNVMNKQGKDKNSSTTTPSSISPPSIPKKRAGSCAKSSKGKSQEKLNPIKRAKRGCPRQCDKCDFVSTRLFLMLRHQKTHLLNDHFAEVEDKKKIKCKHCNRLVANLLSCKSRHMGNFHSAKLEPQAHQCHICYMGFDSLTYLNAHLRYHEIPKKPKSFVCEICGAKRYNENQLTKHRKRAHFIGLDPLVCELCGSVFSRRPALNRHYYRFHPGEKPQSSRNSSGKSGNDKCVTSSEAKATTSKSNVPVEAPTEKTCRHCGKVVMHFKRMSDHYKTEHPELYKFECEICGDKFQELAMLKKHKGAKHSKNKHVCPYCKVELSYAANLHYHWKKHCKEYQRANAQSTETSAAENEPV